MTEHCDHCGTELEPSQARHQRFRVEHVSEDIEALEGCLCSDCFLEFEAWLQTA